MPTTLESYLREIGRGLHLGPEQKAEVLAELYSHVQERHQELMKEGFPEEEALRVALAGLGPPRPMALELYQARSQGSLGEGLLAALPHLLVASLFALHSWGDPYWLVPLLAFFIAVSLYKWRHGRPSWLYPWLGYSLLPLAATFLAALFVLGNGLWLWLGGESYHLSPGLGLLLGLYILFALWALGSIFYRVVRRDWLHACIMSLPLPVIAAWLVGVEAGALPGKDEGLKNTETGTALIFLALALTVAAQVRLRRRALKVGTILTTTPVVFLLTWRILGGRVDPLGLGAVALFSLAFLLVPALLEVRLGPEEARARPWQLYLYGSTLGTSKS